MGFAHFFELLPLFLHIPLSIDNRVNIFFIQCLKLHEHVCHELDLVFVVHEDLAGTVIGLIEKLTHFIIDLLCRWDRLFLAKTTCRKDKYSALF